MSATWEHIALELTEAYEEHGLRLTGHEGMLDYDPRPTSEIWADLREAVRALLAAEREACLRAVVAAMTEEELGKLESVLGEAYWSTRPVDWAWGLGEVRQRQRDVLRHALEAAAQRVGT